MNLESWRLSRAKVLVTDMEFGDYKTAGGIILLDDDGKHYGIRPRWAKVVKVASDVVDLSVDDYVLLKHGRWTRAIPTVYNGEKIKVFSIDYPDAVLLVSSSRPDILDQIVK